MLTMKATGSLPACPTPALPRPFPQSSGCRVHATEKGGVLVTGLQTPWLRDSSGPACHLLTGPSLGFHEFELFSELKMDWRLSVWGLEGHQFVPAFPSGLPHLVHKVRPCALNIFTLWQVAVRILKFFRPQISLSGEVQVSQSQAGPRVQH